MTNGLRRVVFTEGGKGGVGKTTLCAVLVEWYQKQPDLKYSVIDFDSGNLGSLSRMFPSALASDVHAVDGLDACIDELDHGSSVVLADLPPGCGRKVEEWFNVVSPPAKELGLAFTAIGLVTSDPVSVASVLQWGASLQDRTQYVIVRNALAYTDFSYWERGPKAREFAEIFHPMVIDMEHRRVKIQNEARNRGLTLHAIATEHKNKAFRICADLYRKNMFAEFDRVKEFLLP